MGACNVLGLKQVPDIRRLHLTTAIPTHMPTLIRTLTTGIIRLRSHSDSMEAMVVTAEDGGASL